jgi:Putative MetA-pathway of phenol degradation
MRRRSSKSSNGSTSGAHAPGTFALAIVLALAFTLVPRLVWAQACCAGSGAVTPGRLAMHEDALVALSAKAAHVYGSFDSNGHYSTPPPGSAEQNFEQDAIGSLRLPVVDRAQVALIVPLIENRRTSRGVAEFGGGLGDVNFSARYDFLYAGQHRYVPGIAALVGVTFPTGRAPEDATQPQATDATGIGAFQGNLGVAVEQLFGAWLVTAYGIVAKRAPRTAGGIHTALGTQWTALVAVAYSLPHDYAIALSASYTGEGNADVQGQEVAGSARRIPILGLTGVVPLSDHLRLQGGLSANPPIPQLGKNQPATIGFGVTALYAWY